MSVVIKRLPLAIGATPWAPKNGRGKSFFRLDREADGMKTI
jgi:hypothetical protein